MAGERSTRYGMGRGCPFPVLAGPVGKAAMVAMAAGVAPRWRSSPTRISPARPRLSAAGGATAVVVAMVVVAGPVVPAGQPALAIMAQASFSACPATVARALTVAMLALVATAAREALAWRCRVLPALRRTDQLPVVAAVPPASVAPRAPEGQAAPAAALGSHKASPERSVGRVPPGSRGPPDGRAAAAPA